MTEKEKALKLTITAEQTLRPCIVDGRKALFHRWTDDCDVIIKFNTMLPSDKMKEIHNLLLNYEVIPAIANPIPCKYTYGIVEFEDGSIRMVKPDSIIFLDSDVEFSKCCFHKEEK